MCWLQRYLRCIRSVRSAGMRRPRYSIRSCHLSSLRSLRIFWLCMWCIGTDAGCGREDHISTWRRWAAWDRSVRALYLYTRHRHKLRFSFFASSRLCVLNLTRRRRDAKGVISVVTSFVLLYIRLTHLQKSSVCGGVKYIPNVFKYLTAN